MDNRHVPIIFKLLQYYEVKDVWRTKAMRDTADIIQIFPRFLQVCQLNSSTLMEVFMNNIPFHDYLLEVRTVRRNYSCLNRIQTNTRKELWEPFIQACQSNHKNTVELLIPLIAESKEDLVSTFCVNFLLDVNAL